MIAKPHLRLEMVSNPLYLAGARELVASVADRLGMTEDACAHLKLSVDEALCNVIRHGYNSRHDGPIWMSLFPITDEARGSGLKVVIEDEARQVDPSSIRGRDLDEVRPGGLGVHIIVQLMDEVVYERRNPKGMRLTLIKWNGSHAKGTISRDGPGCCRGSCQ